MNTLNFSRLGAVLASVVLAHVCIAEVTIAEPEYVGNIIVVRDGEGVALEKQRASNHARAGFFRGKMSNIVQRAASPVRLTRGEKLQFIVRAATNEVDPAQVVNVFQLISDPRKDYRYIETGSQGMFTGNSMAIEFLPFASERYGESSYLLTFIEPLEAGEYAMTLDGSRDVFSMFGVD
jgi:hypothetical protein